MSRTERLIDNTQNPLARELLRSAEIDRAPDNTAAKVALALGLGSSAIITTVATSAAAGTGFASGTGTAMSASAMGASAVAAVPAAGAVAAAAPAAGAVTALGMLKVMAAVSLACGTLSYGTVKLAVNVAQKPAVEQQVGKPAQGALNHLPRGASGRSVAAFPAQSEANLPAPPAPPDTDDVVAAAHGQESQPLAIREAASARETNTPAVGRHAIPTNSGSGELHSVANAPQIPSNPTQVAPTEAHTAAFPSDEAHAASVNAPPVASSLEREVAQLDQARAALASGQPAQALRELDQYRAQSPRGALAAESVVLRVKALLALGQRAAAEVEASPLLLNAPQSRHAERLREILGNSSSSQ